MLRRDQAHAARGRIGHPPPWDDQPAARAAAVRARPSMMPLPLFHRVALTPFTPVRLLQGPVRRGHHLLAEYRRCSRRRGPRERRARRPIRCTAAFASIPCSRPPPVFSNCARSPVLCPLAMHQVSSRLESECPPPLERAMPRAMFVHVVSFAVRAPFDGPLRCSLPAFFAPSMTSTYIACQVRVIM